MTAGAKTGIAARCAHAAAALAEQGIVVVEQFLPQAEVAAIRAEGERLRAHGQFRRAGIGAGGDFRRRQDIRGDDIHWIEPAGAGPALQSALGALECLRLAVNRELMLGLFELESHLARYSAGAGYQRHYDQFRESERRQLTVTLYLNEQWSSEDGGVLRVYPEDDDPAGVLNILPVGGTMVAFLSARFAHEVLACRRERWSLTGWFLRR